MTSKLTKRELELFAKLSAKSKSKTIAVRLSDSEYQLLKELHKKHGTTISETVRKSFFKTHLHFFKGIAHSKK